MAELRNSFVKGRREGLAKIIVTENENLEKIYPKFTKRFPTTKKYEEMHTYTGFPEASQIPESEDIQPADRFPGYSKTIEPVHFNLSYEISEIGEETLQYAELKKIVPLMTRSLVHAIEKRTANAVFNNGFSSETVGDGLSLYNTAHTLKGETGVTVANRASAGSALTPGALMVELTRLGRTVGDWNLPMPIDGNFTLWVPPDLRFVAAEILESAGRAYVADNTKNVISGIDARVNPYITGTTPWFLEHPMHSTYFVPHGGIRQNMDFQTRNHMNVYQVYCFFEVASLDWRGRIGNPGA